MNKDFQGQQPGEEVLFVFRRHYSVMQRPLAIAALLIGVGSALLFWSDLVASWRLAVYIFSGAVIIFALNIAFRAWLNWYYTIYVVTNRRIRQQIQRSLFKKSVIDIYLDKIHNISYSMTGVMGSISGYGKIVAQTDAGNLVMTRVADCEAIYNQLISLIQPQYGNIKVGKNNVQQG